MLMPDVPLVPELPLVPLVPELPLVPEVPDTPVPDVPAVPDTPVPLVPEVPDTPVPDVPAVPLEPEDPEYMQTPSGVIVIAPVTETVTAHIFISLNPDIGIGPTVLLSLQSTYV